MIKLKQIRTLMLGALAALLPALDGVHAAALDEVAVDGFIAEMSNAHGYDRKQLRALFARTERSERILDLMSRPAEKVKPWFEYRSIFISQRRIREGVAFWRRNEIALGKAFQNYGVPPEVIVAILGVETSYGRITGGHRVIDALATLAFHYPGSRPKRSAFFRAQLEHFLLFTREDQLDPLALKGSYAGAMGIPQFMPENYRKLAVDFDGDGARDIWSNPEDAIGSVGNYLNHHGWKSTGPITARAIVEQGDPAPFVRDEIKPSHNLADLIAAGIKPARAFNDGEPVALFELRGSRQNEYWMGFTNFYVISRYNPRVKYAMAVAHLSEAIRMSRSGSGS